MQASIEMPKPGKSICAIGMTRKDGTEMLRGTASVGRDVTETALSQRLKELKPLDRSRDPARHQGRHEDDAAGGEDGRSTSTWATSIRSRSPQKLKVITEPSPYYSGSDNPVGPADRADRDAERAVPVSRRARTACRCAGPRSACSPIRRSACCAGRCSSARATRPSARWLPLSGSRRTESMWVKTTVFGDDDAPVATMLLNLASIKQSYAPYEKEYAALYA